MKSARVLITLSLSAVALGGCNPQNKAQPLAPSGGDAPQAPAKPIAPATPTGDAHPLPESANKPMVAGSADESGSDVIASISGAPITRRMLDKPLVQAYGLAMLAKLAQLELAKQQAIASHLTVSPQDVIAETDRYVNSLFNEDRDPVLKRMNDDLDKATSAKDQTQIARINEDLRRERGRLLEQLLGQQKVSRPDFELVMETNTYLRKIGESLLKNTITEENLRQAFNQLYGEKVRVKHIALANLQEATEAKRRIASGEPFDQVARVMSRNEQSAALGGELPPFTRDTPGYPQQFKDVAMGLKVGEVSDPVAADGGYHIVKLEERIPPRIVKFEDVKESVRQYLYERQLDSTVKELRARLQRAVAENLKISEPELKQQFEQQVLKREDELKDRNDIRRELERRRQLLKDQSTTAPTTRPTDAVQDRGPETPATAPANAAGATSAPATTRAPAGAPR